MGRTTHFRLDEHTNTLEFWAPASADTGMSYQGCRAPLAPRKRGWQAKGAAARADTPKGTGCLKDPFAHFPLTASWADQEQEGGGVPSMATTPCLPAITDAPLPFQLPAAMGMMQSVRGLWPFPEPIYNAMYASPTVAGWCGCGPGRKMERGGKRAYGAMGEVGARRLAVGQGWSPVLSRPPPRGLSKHIALF